MPATPARLDAHDITGLVLAGGRGRRMGGVDKGLQLLDREPLAQHALRRLRPQVGALLISANRHRPFYEALGAPVLPDEQDDYPGPLAGFLSGLRHCRTPWLLTVPCDTPRFPLDLAQRLGAEALAQQASIAVACAPDSQATDAACPGGALRVQPAFCLLRRHLHVPLAQYLQGGGRRIQAWIFEQGAVRVPFNGPDDDARAFFNANTADDLRTLAGFL